MNATPEELMLSYVSGDKSKVCCACAPVDDVWHVSSIRTARIVSS